MCGRRRCMYATRACGSGRVCALVYLVFGSSLVLGCFVHDCICVGMYDPCVKGPCWLFDISAIFVVAHGACDASCEQALTLHGLSQFAPVLHCVHTRAPQVHAIIARRPRSPGGSLRPVPWSRLCIRQRASALMLEIGRQLLGLQLSGGREELRAKVDWQKQAPPPACSRPPNVGAETCVLIGMPLTGLAEPPRRFVLQTCASRRRCGSSRRTSKSTARTSWALQGL